MSLCYDNSWLNEPYAEMPVERYLIPHLGQRKLLIAEIAFLTEYSDYSDFVLYVGAGPGKHISALAELFPKKVFHLFDPRAFDKNLENYKNLFTFQQYFTDEDAKKYANSKQFKRCLFISDIRTSGQNFENEVRFNLKQQMQWCEILKPKMASLKFRLPFNCTESIVYYAGQIRLQAWVGIDSTETRLWTDCAETIPYGCIDYSEKMFYFNRFLRADKHEVGQCELMDFCNDCAIEWLTWTAYAKKNNKTLEWCCDQVANTMQNINLGPHCKLRDLPLTERITALKSVIEKFHENYNTVEKKRTELNEVIKRKK